jgi:hypothetical protein
MCLPARQTEGHGVAHVRSFPINRHSQRAPQISQKSQQRTRKKPDVSAGLLAFTRTADIARATGTSAKCRTTTTMTLAGDWLSTPCVERKPAVRHNMGVERPRHREHRRIPLGKRRRRRQPRSLSPLSVLRSFLQAVEQSLDVSYRALREL